MAQNQDALSAVRRPLAAVNLGTKSRPGNLTCGIRPVLAPWTGSHPEMTAPARRAGAVALITIRTAAEEQGDEEQARLPRAGKCPRRHPRWRRGGLCRADQIRQ